MAIEGAFASATVGRGRYLRSFGVRERMYKGQNIAFELINIRDVERIPMHLQRTYQQMMFRLEAELLAMAKSLVPGGPEGRLGRQVHAWRVGPRVVVGTVGSEFARALNRGFTSTPKTKRVLRFEEGGEVFFRPRTRVAGRHFFEAWLAAAGPIVEATYESSFYNIKDLV
jgi:hypothetical protein